MSADQAAIVCCAAPQTAGKLTTIGYRNVAAMRIQVECYAGYRGEETPRRIHVGGSCLEVVDVLDRWLDPDHRYFKLQTLDGAIWIVRHDVRRSVWTLTFYQHAPLPRSILPDARRNQPQEGGDRKKPD